MAQSPTVQQALSSVAARSKGKSGPQGAVAALVAQQQESEIRMRKLLETIEKLQQENAQTVRSAAQAGAGAATGIANKIAAGIERSQDLSRRQSERSEDKAFAAQQQKLSADLQKEANREAAQMGAAIQQSRLNFKHATETFQKDKKVFDGALSAYSARIDEMVKAGYYQGEEGRTALEKAYGLIKQARIYGDNRFDDRHIRALYDHHNEQVGRVLKSQDPFSELQTPVDPLAMPVVTLRPRERGGAPSRAVSKLDDMSPQKQFEMKMTGGYPMKGLVFNDEPNFGLPEGETPNLVNPATSLDILADEDMLRGLKDESLRQEYIHSQQKGLVEMSDRLGEFGGIMNALNATYNEKAEHAVGAALEDLVQDPDPAKFNDVGRYITAKALAHTMGGGAQGEEMALIGMEFFDGKREPRTTQDFYTLLAMESASFNIAEHLGKQTGTVDPEKGGTVATRLVSQMINSVGERKALMMMGVEPGKVDLVSAQAVVQDRISESVGFTRRLNEGMHSSGIMQQYKDRLRSSIQRADLFSIVASKDEEQRQARVDKLMGTLEKPPGEGGPTLSELQSQDQTRETPGRDLRQTTGLLDAMLDLSRGLGPDRYEETAAFITNNLDPVTSADLSGYLKQTEVDKQRSPYTRAAVDRDLFADERHQKLSREDAKKGPSFQQSATQGGTMGVIMEQWPALASLAGRGMAFGIDTLNTSLERTGAGVSQVLGGTRASGPFVRGVSALGGHAPIATPGEQQRIQELSPDERTQILQESNRNPDEVTE